MTAAVIGSVVCAPPPNCVPVDVGGAMCQQCGTTWHQPQYAGTQVQFLVVAPPAQGTSAVRGRRARAAGSFHW